MNLFINDIPVQLVEKSKTIDEAKFNTIINSDEEAITKTKLLHRVWIKNVSVEDVEKILDELDTTIITGFISVTLSVNDYEGVKAFLKRKFKIIKAAGGLVRKKDKILMIYRLKKWDLPKGKFEKGEKPRQAAQREVEEECNITVTLGKKICTTWHTYTMKRKQILKKTTWYVMDVVKDKEMKPQIEEDIEEVRWLTPKEVFHALEDSYKSISFVFDYYFKSLKEKSE